MRTSWPELLDVSTRATLAKAGELGLIIERGRRRCSSMLTAFIPMRRRSCVSTVAGPFDRAHCGERSETPHRQRGGAAEFRAARPPAVKEARGRMCEGIYARILRFALKISGKLVGVRGFEPPTPSSRTRCATRLRYTPTAPRAAPARLIVGRRRAAQARRAVGGFALPAPAAPPHIDSDAGRQRVATKRRRRDMKIGVIGSGVVAQTLARGLSQTRPRGDDRHARAGAS